MKFLKLAFLLPLAVFCLPAPAAHSQAIPTATEDLHFSAFGAATGTFTGLEGGRNLGVTAGLDFALRPFHGLFPSLEARGTYPIHPGTIAAQKDVLGGIRIDHPINRYRIYANFLAGRGQIDYQRGGMTVGNLTYISTTSTVYSPGGGIDVALHPRVSLKADYQFQLWNTPVTPSGSIHSNVISLGAIYNFDFNHRYHLAKHPASTGEPNSH